MLSLSFEDHLGLHSLLQQVLEFYHGSVTSRLEIWFTFWQFLIEIPSINHTFRYESHWRNGKDISFLMETSSAISILSLNVILT